MMMDADSISRCALRIAAPAWSKAVPDLRGLVERVVGAALTAEGGALAGRAAVDVTLLDDRAIGALNARWRGRDRPTNVLAFPALLPGDPLPPAPAPVLLGDVVVAFETAAAEAAAQRIALADHLAHLLVHGVLHLLGHDHEAQSAAERMEACEVAILAGLGIADPYAASAPAAAGEGP
jgi:probable rRNA maturation factor